MRNDRGGVIVGYFTKIALVLVVFGSVCFDAVSVGAARISVEDTARAAAQVAAENYNESRDVEGSYRRADAYATEHGATLIPDSFFVDDDGRVTLRVEKEATTLLVYRTKKTAKWAHVEAGASVKAV